MECVTTSRRSRGKSRSSGPDNAGFVGPARFSCRVSKISESCLWKQWRAVQRLSRSAASAMLGFNGSNYDEAVIRAHAEQFSHQAFRRKMQAVVDEVSGT